LALEIDDTALDGDIVLYEPEGQCLAAVGGAQLGPVGAEPFGGSHDGEVAPRGPGPVGVGLVGVLLAEAELEAPGGAALGPHGGLELLGLVVDDVDFRSLEGLTVRTENNALYRDLFLLPFRERLRVGAADRFRDRRRRDLRT